MLDNIGLILLSTPVVTDVIMRTNCVRKMRSLILQLDDLDFVSQACFSRRRLLVKCDMVAWSCCGHLNHSPFARLPSFSGGEKMKMEVLRRNM